MSEIFEMLRQLCADSAAAGYLPESFSYPFVVNSVLCALIIGPMLGGIGTMVVVKRLAFFSQAIGQAALTGVALGILLGEPYTSPYVSLFAFCILFGMAMNYTKNHSSMSSDTLIGVYLAISIAAGACILLYVTSKISIHVLDSVMFGSILTVGDTDIIILAIIAIICVVIAVTNYNKMLLGSFNASLANVRGVRVVFLDYVFIFMITILTVASAKIVGSVLVEALLLIPAVTARNLSRSIKSYFFISVTVASLSCFLGVLLPIELKLPLPSGGAIIIVAAMLFFLSFALRPFITLFRK